MAASLDEIYPKRKLELEDITNKLKVAKVEKGYYRPVQERSPSPSTPSCSLSPKEPPSPQKDSIQKSRHRKSVSFELSKNQHYESLPLLTPKDDDYESESEENHDCSESRSLHEASTESENSPHSLENNPDYIALALTREVLSNTKEEINADLNRLSKLRNAASTESKLALVEFYMKLICDPSLLPAPHSIISAPQINWAKYHPGLLDVNLSNECTNENRKSLFKQPCMFD